MRQSQALDEAEGVGSSKGVRRVVRAEYCSRCTVGSAHGKKAVVLSRG